MDKQVLSRAQMQELIDMGIDIYKASMHWWIPNIKYPNNIKLCLGRVSDNYEKQGDDVIPTFTLQDMLEYIKGSFGEKGDVCLFYEGNVWICSCMVFNSCEQSYYNDYEQIDESPLVAAFNMLKWCKQNNYI